MIKYHGTPLGGKRRDAAEFLVGRNALVSFYRPDDLPAVLEFADSFVFDSGAYSHWRAGGSVDFDAYVDWVHRYHRHPGFSWCLIPDAIDGSEAENMELVERWVSGEHEAAGVPVWHMHESLDWLRRLAGQFERVAIGSSGQWSRPGSKAWWARMAEVMTEVCDGEGRPRCKLHGLRMLDPDIFTRLPLSSADSANAAINGGSIGRFGVYPPPTAGQRMGVVASRIECQNSSSIWSGAVQKELF